MQRSGILRELRIAGSSVPRENSTGWTSSAVCDASDADADARHPTPQIQESQSALTYRRQCYSHTHSARRFGPDRQGLLRLPPARQLRRTAQPVVELELRGPVVRVDHPCHPRRGRPVDNERAVLVHVHLRPSSLRFRAQHRQVRLACT